MSNLSNLDVAVCNGKVWSRRFGIDFNKELFIETLGKIDPEYSSTLRIPLALVLFRVLNNKEWASSLPPKEKRMLAALVAEALTLVVRQEESNILTALGKAVQKYGENYAVLLSQHSFNLCSLVTEGVTARTKEKSKPSIANLILQRVK